MVSVFEPARAHRWVPKGGGSVAALVLLLALTATPVAAIAQGEPASPDSAVFSLANGLSVVLDLIPGRGSVVVGVAYEVGTLDEPPGWSGLAHVTEHLMFLGPGLDDAEPFDSSLARLGALSRNARTEPWQTFFHETVPPESLEGALWLEARRMGWLLLETDAADLEVARRLVLLEDATREFWASRAPTPSIFAQRLFGSEHPLGWLEASVPDIEAIDLETVQAFWQSWYRPDNATLIVSGEFDPAEARRLVEVSFGALRATGPAGVHRPVPPVARMNADHRIVVNAPTAHHMLLVAWPTPTFGAPDDAALDAVAALATRRLATELVAPGIAYSARAWQSSGRDTSVFAVTIELPASESTRIPLPTVESIIAGIADGGDDDELAQALRDARALPTRIADDPTWRARCIAAPMRFGELSRYRIAADRARYDALDGAAVVEAARAWLPADRRLVAWVQSDESAPPGGLVVGQRIIAAEPE